MASAQNPKATENTVSSIERAPIAKPVSDSVQVIWFQPSTRDALAEKVKPADVHSVPVVVSVVAPVA